MQQLLTRKPGVRRFTELLLLDKKETLVDSDVHTRQEAPLAEDCTAALASCALAVRRLETSLVLPVPSTGFVLSTEAVGDPYGDIQLGGETQAERT